MGVSNWFGLAAENVGKFAKAAKNIVRVPAGKVQSASFRLMNRKHLGEAKKDLPK